MILQEVGTSLFSTPGGVR